MNKKPNKKISCERFLKMFNGGINKNGTSIRFVKSNSYNYCTGRSNITYGYFDVKDNIIVSCERGYSEWKNYELTDIQECWENNPELRLKDIFTGEEY